MSQAAESALMRPHPLVNERLLTSTRERVHFEKDPARSGVSW